MSEEFDLLAGQLQYAREQSRDFLEELAVRFERALPGAVNVVRQWRILGGKITEIDLHLADMRYRIESRHPPSYTVSRQPIAHGIAVGMAEELPPATWVMELCRDLERNLDREGSAAHTMRNLLHE